MLYKSVLCHSYSLIIIIVNVIIFLHKLSFIII